MNLKTLNFNLIFPAIFTLLMGCSGYQYVASPRYVPLNEKKGELTTNVYASGLQVGCAFSNKFSVFATGYSRYPTIKTSSLFATDKNHRAGDSREVNIGLSYFKRYQNQVYEVLVGGGMGNMSFSNAFESDKNYNAYYTFDMHARRRNIFIQPNFSLKFSPKADRHLAIAVFTKVNAVQYYNIRTESELRSEARPDAGFNFFRSRTEAISFLLSPELWLGPDRIISKE